MPSLIETATVQVDENGRITLPQSVLEWMRLEPGATLIMEATADAELHLHIAPETAPLVNENGIWIIAAKPTASIEDVIERDREDRMQFLSQGIPV